MINLLQIALQKKLLNLFDEEGGLGIFEKLREKFLGGNQVGTKNDINRLNSKNIGDVVEALEISEDQLDYTPKGNISANKKNKELIWNVFNQNIENEKADYEEAAELGFSKGNNDQEQDTFENPFDTHDETSDNTQSEESIKANNKIQILKTMVKDMIYLEQNCKKVKKYNLKPMKEQMKVLFLPLKRKK